MGERYTGPWVAGMLTADGERIVRVDDGVVTGWQDMDTASWHVTSMVGRVVQPDWADGGTVGALAGVVRELYGDPYAHTAPVDDHGRRRWICRVLPPGDKPMHLRLTDFYEDTEPAAWLAAYHAHPTRLPTPTPELPSRSSGAGDGFQVGPDHAVGPWTDGDADAAGVSAKDVEDMKK